MHYLFLSVLYEIIQFLMDKQKERTGIAEHFYYTTVLQRYVKDYN